MSHAARDGGEPLTLLLHGGGVSGWMWRPVLDQWGPTGGTLVPDLPGHGTRSHETYVSHAATVAELAESIASVSPAGVHIIGFSLGAQLAILLASQHPHLVRSTVIVSAESVPAPLPRTTLALLRVTAPLARRSWFAQAQGRQLGIPEALVPEFVAESQRLSPPTLVNSVAENIQFTLPAEWSAYPGPVAVVVGAKERGLMRRSAQLTHRAAAGSTLHTIPAAAHDAPFSAPAALAAIAREVRLLSEK